MTKKDILNLALNHKNGPVPFDLGATMVTGLHCSVVEKLRSYYGLEEHPVIVSDTFQMLGEVESDLKAAMDVDMDYISEDCSAFGFPKNNKKEWRTPWGQLVLVPEGFHVTVGADNATYLYPCGNVPCEPCAKLPSSGYFFDTITRGHTYDEDEPHVEENLEEFGVIGQAERDFLKKQLERHAGGERALVFDLGGCSLGDVSAVPGPGLINPKGLRDVSEWYMAIISNPDYIREIFERQTDIALQNLKIAYDVLGESVSVILVCGTDFGAQNAPFCSRDTFRSLYMPYYLKMNDWIHSHTGWKTFKHSCGSIRPLLGDIIDSGFDIINPVQWSAADMNPQTLKNEFGKDVVFWGGGINTQSTLPFGTPEQVREEALRMLEIFSRDGGYVYTSIHNIQANTPVENVVAFIDAVHAFNGR